MPVLKTYYVDHVRNCKYALNGVIPSDNSSTVAALKKPFRSHMVLKAAQLPPTVDLRPFMTAVEQQQQTNSCVANAFAGAYEYLLKRATGSETDVSRLFLYYNARARNNPSGYVSDTGCMLDQAVAALYEQGICLESIWPFNPGYKDARPSAQAYEAAKGHKIVDWFHVNTDLEEMKTCLAQGYPFAFGTELFASFYQPPPGGRIPMPTPYDVVPQGQQHKYHAMLCVGYCDQYRVFAVRNSWGQGWGDNGYCYMPYEYLTNRSWILDAWAIRKVATNDFNRDAWSNDSSYAFGAEAPHLLHSGEQDPKKLGEIITVEEPDPTHEVVAETTIDAEKSEAAPSTEKAQE